MSPTPLISCQSISKSYGTLHLFSDISLGFFPDERLGLIGPNGSGKTTLLKIFAGIETPNAGKTSQQRNTSLGYLPQEDVLNPDLTIKETLFESCMDLSENWVSDRFMRELIQHSGFSDLEQEVASLSGGWRKRLAICRAFVQKPDLLLMDEPTNHLDLEGILWLENLLNSAKFAFVVISHDRTFLENTCNRTLELSRMYAEGFLKVEGNYSAFLKQRESFINAQKQLESTLSSQVRREVAWLARGPKARATKARFRIDQAWALQDELSAVKMRQMQNKTAQIDFEATHRKTKVLLRTKGLGIKRGHQLIFDNLDLTLSPGFCIGILGKNGVGKSTLIHLLNRELLPDSGSIQTADDVQIVTFGQKREQLDKDQSLQQALCPSGDQVIFRGQSLHIANWSSRFLFDKDQLRQPVSRLSGGEQARVLIANLMLKPADILLLDEPTNDLDIPTREILEESLADFPGAIVLITHDRFLLDRLSDVILSLEGKGKAVFYADYHQWIQAQVGSPSSSPSPGDAKPVGKKGKGGSNKQRREDSKELGRIESKIVKADKRVMALKKELDDPEIASDADGLLEISALIREAENKVEQLYERWEGLEGG